MTPTTQLQELGQSLWLDNITCGQLAGGSIWRYINEWSVLDQIFEADLPPEQDAYRSGRNWISRPFADLR